MRVTIPGRAWFHSLSSTEKELFMAGTDILGTLIVVGLYYLSIVPLWFVLLSIGVTIVDILGLRLLFMAKGWLDARHRQVDE